MWDAGTGREARRFTGHKQMVSGLALSGGSLLSSSHDQTVRVWDVAAGGEVAVCVGHTGAVAAVASGQGGVFASGGLDGAVRVWKYAEGGSHASG